MHIVDTKILAEIAEIEFSEIVEDTLPGLNRLRILLKEDSFIDIWYSLTNVGRYAYHWHRKDVDGTIYRHNNAPHKKWMKVSTFPRHFHNGSEEKVESSELPEESQEAIKYFLAFAQDKIKSKK